MNDATALRLVANALEQHKQTLAEYEDGRPETALDNAGDTLDVSIAALEVITNDLVKAHAFAAKIKERSPDQFKWLASEEATAVLAAADLGLVVGLDGASVRDRDDE